MDANNSNPTAQQSVILTLAVVLLCRAMWKFLHRVDPDATPDDQQQQIRIGGSGTADQNGSGSARSLSIDASATTTTSTKTVTSIKTTTTTDDHQLINRPGQQQHQQQTNILDQDLNNNDKSETDVTPPDTVDGTIVESPFLKNFKQNKIAQAPKNTTFHHHHPNPFLGEQLHQPSRMDYYEYYENTVNIEEATKEYETSVYKYKDERDAIQKKTFTKWVNKHLIKVTKGVVDLFEDLRDGNNLISLLEILSGETLAREKGKMRVHHLQNVQTALKFLTGRNIKLVNIRPDDIVDGNPKLTLGLIWTIILHFQLSDIILYDDTISFKEALLKWARKTTEGYPDVNVKDFTHSWKDGLAFNAILHRNRPDLLDYRSCRGKSARENLEHAFSIYESLGVTRLLDPEDVDCKTPDEKSLITYISSLYELFPEPPENNPLLDNERLKQIEHYKKLAENLVCWLRESTRKLNDRQFPATVKESKRLQEEAYRFRSEEIPPHHADKQLLVSSYKEILKMALALPVRIEEEYKAESIEASWATMMKAFQERDRALKDHLARLGDLEGVAEKLRRNIKECDRALESISSRVFEEAKRVHKVNPLEPNYPVEQLEKELKYEEERITSMLKDAKYLLEEGYPRAAELHKQVLDLQQRHAEIALDFKTKVLDVLEDRRAKAQRKPLTEAELIASNPSFRFLHECIEWCKEKQRKIASAGFAADVFSLAKQLDEQQGENGEIAAFQSKVDRCDSAKSEFSSEEDAAVLEIYVRMLGRLHKLYAELKGQAGRRLSDLESLLELLKEVDVEGKWTEDVISAEVLRNWSTTEPPFNLAAVEEDHRKLYYEIQSHEHRQEAIVSRAERLLRGEHPAREVIDSAVSGLLFRKKLLVEQFNSLDEHKRGAAEYHRFHKEVAEVRGWLEKAAQSLNSTFSVQSITFEEGDRLNREMLALKEEINRRRATVAELESRSKSVLPLKLRTSSAAVGGRAVSLVSISGQSLKLSKGEQLTVRDNSDAFGWKVATRGGEDYTATNLCFSIPPPDQESISLAAELKRLHEELISLWAAKHHELRQNMLLATIRSLKSWDYPTYCSKDPAQREAILSALSNDIDKVVSESAPGDRKSQQLLDEFADLKRQFAEYEARRKAESDAVALQKLLDAFVDSISGLLAKLQEKERLISKKLQEPIPRKVDQIKTMVLEHKDFEVDTRRYEPAVEKAKAEYAKLPKSPVTQPKYEALIDCWNKIWSSSNVYIERLKALEIVLRDIDDAHRLIAGYEIKLSRAADMPAELEQARAIFEELKSIHGEVQRHSASFDKLLSNVSKVRRLVERSRLQQSSNADIDRLEEEVKALHKRWDNIGVQIADRIKSLENCHDLLKAYRSRMDKEGSWFKQTRSRLEEVFRRRELSAAKQLYEDVSSHKSSIEETNSAGNRFSKEAKIYDLKLKNYRETVAEQAHPSLDASAKRSKVVNGVETVAVELKALNEEYKATLDRLLALLNQLQDDESKLREFSNTITFENITTTTMSTSAVQLGNAQQQVEVATTSRTSSTSSSSPSTASPSHSSSALNDNANHKPASHDNGHVGDDNVDAYEVATSSTSDSDDSDDDHHSEDSQRPSRGDHGHQHHHRQNGHTSASANTKVQIYHQKSTVATGSKVPLDDSTFSANAIVSTVNVTQNIKSAKVAEGVTEITINRVYETAVKNSTCIVKSSKVITGTKYSAIGMESAGDGSFVSSSSSSSSSSTSSINSSSRAAQQQQQAEEYFEDRLSEHEEYEERQESDDIVLEEEHQLSEHSYVPAGKHNSTATAVRKDSEPMMAQLYEQFEAEVENLQREQSFIEQQEAAVSRLEPVKSGGNSVISTTATTTVLHSQPVTSEHYGQTEDLLLEQEQGEEEVLSSSEQRSYSQFSTVTSEMKLPLQFSEVVDSERVISSSEEQRAELLSSTTSKKSSSSFSGMQSADGYKLSSQTLVTSSFSSSSVSSSSYVSSYVTSSSLSTTSVSTSQSQSQQHPLLSSIPLLSQSPPQYHLPATAAAATVSVIQTDDRVAKDSISINFDLDRFTNLRTGEEQSIGESIHQGLLDFKVLQADGSELLLSECVQEDGLIVLPSSLHEVDDEPEKAMSFSELITAGLLTAANCTLKFAGRELPFENRAEAAESRRRSSSSSASESPEKPSLSSSSTLVEQPNFPSVLTISSEAVSRETAKVLSVVGNFDFAAVDVDLATENELTEKLFQWLVQKERLISDLGPICSEPRALASQLQQVQSLKEDFASQSPLLNQMDKLGDSLLERLDSAHPEVRRIKARRQEIHEKWAALSAALGERERQLLAVKDAAAAFQSRYERLLAALHKIGDDFERIVASGADNEEQLLKLSNLEENLDMQRPAVADLEGACERLVDLLTDAASKSEVRGRVSDLRKLYDDLSKRITDKKAQLQSTLKEEKDFHYDCDAVQDWLRGMTARLGADFGKVSALLEKVTRQVEDFEPLYREVLNKEHEIHILLTKGAQLQRRLTRPQDVSQLASKMEAIKRAWATLKEEATGHHTKLQKCLDIAKRYNGALSTFLPWLKEMEAKVRPPSDLALTKAQLEKVLREFQMHKSEIARHSAEFENVCSLGESLIASADVDTEVIRDQLNDLKRRWADLQQELGKGLERLEKLLAKLNAYGDKARDLGLGLGRLDDKLNSLNDKDPRQLEKIKAMLEEAKGLGDQLEQVKKVGFNLIDEAGPNVDSSPVRDELRGFDDKFNTLNNRLADANRDLEKASKALGKYNDALAEITRQLTALEEKFDRMAPIGRTVKVVEQQLDEMADFNQKLSSLKGDLKQAEKDCADIIANGFTTDPSGLRSELENLVRKHDRLTDRAAQRTDALKEALDRLRALFKALKENMADIKSVLAEVDAFKPISRDVETIRAQKAEFQAFQRGRVDPLASRIAAVSKAGNELIQSAPHGVSTAELETELGRHGDQWDELKNRLGERERRLDQALLQAGRFKDALSSVEKWLAETEEMVRGQKPPSSDYVALKAQLQEQRYLVKMLTDRAQSIEALQALGKEFMANLERGERAQIEKQLADIDRRFRALVANADERMKVLEACLPVAKEFAERIVPLQEWLQQAARRLTALQSFSVEQEKLSRRIGEHKAFHGEVVDHGRDFSDLAAVAQRLIRLVANEEEGQQVTGRLAAITDQYAKLVEDSLALGRLLADSFAEIGKWMARLEAITAWLADTDARLAGLKTLSISPDKLAAQCEELADIVGDVNQKQSTISEFVAHGQQLLNRFGSANDSMFIRAKAEAVQSRYNDLRQRANDRLEAARASLSLAQKFYAAHDQLNGWMDEAEERLSSMDGLSLHQQNSIITGLEGEVPAKRRLLETVTSVGAEFARTSQGGQNASTINGLVSKAVRRFDAIVEQLTRRAEKLRLALEQNAALGNEVDELLDWFKDAERQLMEAEPIVPNYEELLVLLRETKSLNDDINSQRGRVREVVANVKRLMRETAGKVNDDLAAINGKTDELKELAGRVSQLAQDRLAAIEHALPLVEHFFATHQEITTLLDEVEAEVQRLATPSIYAEQIRKQQEATKRLIQTLASHKPLMERLNKTGAELIALLPRKADARAIQQIIDGDNERYNRLRGLLREHQNNLETALQATAQFSDKLDGMLNALNNTHDQLKNAEPISAHVPKIKEQIADNNAIRDDLAKREGAFNAVKAQAKEVISKAGKSDEPAIRDIRNKLDRLNDLWNECQRLAGQRGASLDEALKLAVKFWNDLANVMRAIKELEETLNAQEPPAVEPAKIQQQQKALAEIRHDMERTKPEVEKVKRAGASLMKIIGEPDRPEVRKNLEDLDSAWDNVTALYARREKNLIDAMEKAMNFHEKMKGLLDFLNQAEERLTRLGPIAADIEAVKRQMGELKALKAFVDPHMVEVEALNRMAHELLDRVPPGQARGIRDAVADINRRWKDLLKAIGDRQSALENALLKLGQFQQALNELLAWIAKVERALDDAEPVYGDPQVIEVELAKHKVLMNDIHAHQASVDSLNAVGKQLIEAEAGGSESARNTRRRLDDLNKRWATLLDKANGRNQQLEECLRESQCLAQEIQDMLGWLNEIDGLISTSKPVGGLPETAREQLNRFMEVYNELDMARHKVEALLQNGEHYVGKAKEGAAVHLSHNLKVLKTKWENILSRANDRKIKLEIALKEATEFHEALQAFVDWLTGAEKYLSNLQPVSRVLDSVLKQIEEHKHFQKDIGHHRETMLNLDKKGTHLKYFSQKQDVTLIKNLLASVQHRWERVLTKAAERARALDHGFKEAKEFYDAWSDLIGWLDDAERTLDSIQQLGNNPDLIKQTLYRHKEFQRQLGAKQSAYDSTMRFGKGLKEKCPREDVPILQEMLDELKNKWNAVCQKSVDKQRKLEEALLFSGQFKDAIQALIEWLEKARQLLAFDQPVHGDLDTVNGLIEGHKNFVEDFNSRESNLNFVRRTAADLVRSAAPEDARQIKAQMDTLEEKWAEIERMAAEKQVRLADALKEAERLHQSVHALLEWLSDAELKLRFAGPLPEDEAATRAHLAEHEAFLREMKQQELSKNGTLDLARSILSKCHPNATPVIKHWITIIQSRWDEVESWANQRAKRLNDHLKSLKDSSDLLGDLLGWLAKTEADLVEQEAVPLPDDVITLEKLIDDHQRLIDELNDKQVDVERVVKAYSAAGGKKAGTSSKERPRSRVQSGHRSTSGAKKDQEAAELRNPKAKELLEKWQVVWKLAMERMKRLKDSVNYNREIEKMRNFDFDDWRRRYLFYMEHKKAKLMDFYKRLDKDGDGRITKTEFIDGVLNSRFGTNRLEMERVADIFDLNGDRYIDQKEYLETLRPDKEGQPKTESEIIQDEVQRQVGKCTCMIRYKVYQVGEGKYRFGDSQKLRLVRILRSTVMVRVGGGWVSLEEFLTKNDPCRARGRTNVELREQFVLADGVSQSMTPFKAKAPSPFKSDGSVSLTGPISKIREKTERSIPMSQGYRFGNLSNDSDQEDLKSRPRSRVTPSSSRANSRPGSRQSSQPPSRTASDMSAESLDGYNRRGLRAKTGTSTTGTTTAGNGTTASGMARTPSFGSKLGASSSSIGPRWK